MTVLLEAVLMKTGEVNKIYIELALSDSLLIKKKFSQA